jgi:catechol 2,3-dioxygenase-like lactoylglutathione lyase family enzyme
MTMEAFIATKLDDYAQGKISRRKLIDTFMFAATAVAATTDGAKAAPSDPTLKVALVNHVSYTCPNFREAADWYSKVLNLEQVGPSKTDVALPFGKRGEKPIGVTANDVPLPHLIIRSRDLNAPAAGSQEPRRKPRALVQHMGYTVANFDREKAKAELNSLGVKGVRDGGLYSLHMLDPFGYDIQLSGFANNALSDGA